MRRPSHDAHDALAAQGFSAPPDAAIMAIRAGACPRCALEQARDWAVTARWLSESAEEAARPHGALGVVCCPLHAWRLALATPAREATGVAMRGAMDGMDGLAALSAGALDHLLHDAWVAMTRLERTGAARWLRPPRALTPGWFGEPPACPLCARLAHEAPASRVVDEVVDEVVGKTMNRAQLCGGHRASGSPLAQGEAAEAAHARWWLAPGAPTRDVAFIRRLLQERGEPRFPDDLCPLCVARVEHERALIAALAAGEAFTIVALGGGGGAHAPERAPLRIDLATLCARHTALLRAPARVSAHAGAGVDGVGATDTGAMGVMATVDLALAGDAPGALRAQTSERDCPACAIVAAWELARIEGLHRAAGGAPLSESVTARLVWELDHGRYQFCAPHLRRLLRFGPTETTWAALGPSVMRRLEELRDRIRNGTSGLSGQNGRSREIIRRIAAATLAGLPA